LFLAAKRCKRKRKEKRKLSRQPLMYCYRNSKAQVRYHIVPDPWELVEPACCRRRPGGRGGTVVQGAATATLILPPHGREDMLVVFPHIWSRGLGGRPSPFHREYRRRTTL
jgi:hypothetical protein